MQNIYVLKFIYFPPSSDVLGSSYLSLMLSMWSHTGAEGKSLCWFRTQEVWRCGDGFPEACMEVLI